MNDSNLIKASFRARAHVLRLLGDQLIGSDSLAVFELVKNAFDADATYARVRIDLKKGKIIVSDDGVGMSLDVIRHGWLELGSDLKRGKNRKRTEKFNRMPLGEKGVGRLAAFKLGSRITIITRKEGEQEYKVKLDLDMLTEGKAYLEDSFVEILGRQPETYRKNRHGTRIIINNLRRLDWSKREIRKFKRLVESLNNPFQDKEGSFRTILEVPDKNEWLEDLLSMNDIIDQALWEFSFNIDEDGSYSWTYDFRSPPGFHSLKSDSKSKKHTRLLLFKDKGLLEEAGMLPTGENEEPPISLKTEHLQGIGSISGKFFIYNRRSEVLKRMGGAQSITKFLDEQCGVRVYRDNVRVYNYGEPGDDWLGLNARRVSRPGKRMDVNTVIAAVDLDLEASLGLEEKTNREGFDENDVFRRFRFIMQCVAEHLDSERQESREKLQNLIAGKKPDLGPEAFKRNLQKIKNAAEENNLSSQLGSSIDAVEREYGKLQTVLAHAGAASMNLSLVFHEVEREVARIESAVKQNLPYEELVLQLQGLSQLLEGFSPVLKRSMRKTMSASKVLERVQKLNESRFRAHKITFSCPILGDKEETDDVDFDITGAMELYFGAINNLIDNSIFWTRSRRDDELEKENNNYLPAILVKVLTDWDASGPVLVVIDNGPGFQMDHEAAFQAYMSTRAGGMGLGLKYARLVMESQGGAAFVADVKDFDIPDVYDGSAVVLRFSKR